VATKHVTTSAGNTDSLRSAQHWETIDADGRTHRGSIAAALPRTAARARSRRTPALAL